ncbi:ubiquitin carboxyl-terminal hydrolase 2-like isoform X2 [Homarus americanus]|uniref:ubiquitin carboxyl-terminal hydrolase 2-like isoform X2 n=1 Tax=Homarus americanus TaxID=6706 RepID=UPI001C43FEB0|nr:ubiquitin carboxyl-terminal hydrolase 2-like isoform X2 [Homarus americanus]
MKEALNQEREMKEALKREKEINEALNQEREMKEALKKEKEINEALNQETQKKEADNSTQINTTPALSVISISFKGSETQETPTEGTSGEDSPQDSSECVVLQQKIRELQHDRLGLESQVSTLQAALDKEREKLDKNHQEYTQIISEQEKEIHNLKINMLFKAVWKCDSDTVRKLRKGDFNFNSAVNLDGERVVDEAVRQSNVAVLRELLLGGVHINAPNSRGDTPLHTAIRRGRYCKVISELHNSGADWRAPDARGWDPLQLATALGQIKTLEISIRDESINLTSVIDRLGSTLLHYAAANKQKEMAKWLVKEQGLQKDIEDEMGYQAKDYAAMVGESGLAQWLSSDKLRHIPVVKRLSVHSRQKQDQLALDQLRVHDEMDLQGIGTLTRNTGMLNISTDALNVSTGMQTRDTSTPNRLSSGSIGTPTASLDMLAAPRGKNKTHARGRKKGQAPSLSSSTTEVSYLSNRQDSLNGPITVAQTHHRDLRISGLPNLGNTCYINSVLQCLYHTHLLTQHFITGKYSKEIDETAAHDGRVAKAYERVIRAMWTGDNIKDHLQNLKELAGRLDDLFLDDQQKEAHDFLTQVLEWLHLDLGQEVVTSNKEEEEEMLRNNRGRPMLRSFISELFYGCQHNSIVCGRNGQVICHSEESFSNLTLYVNTKKQYSLNELLKQYYRQQDIVWECDYCGEEHMCLQHSVITSPPRLLLLYINRVNEDTKSSHKTLVTYPECDLSLHPYTKDNHSPSYNLYAVCGHQGSMTSGHYTAFCKIKSSTSKGWYYFSDAQFSRANTQDVFFNPDAHMLFYEAK